MIKEASVNSFQSLGGGYAKDNWKVFYKGEVVKEASANSFKYTGNGYAEDTWRSFYKGRAMGR
ncbi:MAG: DKNYY domain-containing protein [Bacteroides sp.]|nr:DKNYY domain-containing protein [Bacteroides sp.]